MRLKHFFATAALATVALVGSVEAQTFSTFRGYWNAAPLDNMSSSSASIYASPPSGYGWYRDEGLVFSPSVALPAGLQDMKRLERWYSPSLGDYFTTTHSAWQGSAGQTRPSDYSWAAHEGWVFPNPVAGTSDLRLFYSSARGDNFVTSDTRYTTYNSVPGYISVGSQGYIINDALGQTGLIDNFNFGQMHNGGPAVGITRLQLILISYIDSPMRHTAAQYQSLFFGGGFPSVNNAFWANSMGSVLWSNPVIRGPVILANDPDTTGNESRWQDVWDPTFAPFLYLGLRASSGVHFVTASGGPGTGTSVSAPGVDAWETLALADVNGGNLISGDTCAFKTLNGTWLRITGTTVMGDGASSATSDCRFVATKVSGSAGTQVMNGDVIRLQSVSTGKFIRAIGGGGSSLICDTTTGSADTGFAILKTGISSVLQAREALKAAVATGGLNLSGFDDNFDGVITDDEMQLFLIGASPTMAGGAGTRGVGPYSPPGSSVSVNLNHVVGAGEDVSFMTIVHELSHALGVAYELYGSANLNQDMAVMGATIYSNPDDRRTYLHDPWTRMRFGWLHPRIFSLTDAGASAALEVSDAYPETSNKRPILLVDPLHFNFSTGEGEFFMLEYRNPTLSATSYDTNCAAQGLFLWHCKTGPGGTNIVIPSSLGACCTGAACTWTRQPLCTGGSVFKGNGTMCDAGNVCPAGSPPPVKAIDGSINLQGGFPGSGMTGLPYIRGGTAPWTQSSQPSGGIVPKYFDGSDAAVHIRVGSTSADGRTLNVEWSYSGDLPPRIDSISSTRFRGLSTVTMTGMFPVGNFYIDIHHTDGSLFSGTMPITRTLSQITLRVNAPVGMYLLSGRESSFHGNSVLVQVLARSDWNEDGFITVADIFAFLADWFAGNGDYDLNGANAVNDIFVFLSDWFAHL